MKKIVALIALLLLSAPARAIELSLEENRAERGSVGFVDMQRLFLASPDAQHAKESFEELVRQAEERVNMRKAELLKLHQQLDAYRSDRDALAKTAAEAPPPAPLIALSSATAPALSTAPAAVAAAPLAPEPPKLLPRALPGMSPRENVPVATSTAAAAPLASSIAAFVAASSAAYSIASSSKPFSVAASSFSATASTAPTFGQRLLEIDGKIIAVQAEAAKKEAALVVEHDDADRGLLDVESRKTDQVLAHIYRAIAAVAHNEGVSVVVDKTNLLYGRQTVDLTDKVLKYLKENPAQ